MNELIAKLKKLSIFKHKWVQFLMYLIKNFIDDNCSQKAALLTYTTLLSIVPILTLLFVILSTIPQLADVREQIQNAIFSNMLPSTGLQAGRPVRLGRSSQPRRAHLRSHYLTCRTQVITCVWRGRRVGNIIGYVQC